ncbi:MAG: undecaprenyl-diphosphate phosphatase [Saccharofermentanales bacterium]|jgi:undecaprenyl-diphosphatase
MAWLDVLKSVLYGIVEGITEWLPVSSTGHIILLERLVPFTSDPTGEFFSFYLVVIQFGAIMAVVTTFWRQLWPFPKRVNATPPTASEQLRPFRIGSTPFVVDRRILRLWLLILIACVPAGIIGVLFDDQIEALFYNPWTVAVMLILVGIAFLVVERWLKKRGDGARVHTMEGIDWRIALAVGAFQVIAAVFPGTSRSGATILGGLMIGMTRPVAATFTFYLAVPVMLGASLLKLFKLGIALTGVQWLAVLVGMGVAYLVSVLIIRFLLAYIRKHDFRVFAYYRIVLGLIVIIAAVSGFFQSR